eukprot:jgi/Ulvmu1/3630/UM017_0042.1
MPCVGCGQSILQQHTSASCMDGEGAGAIHPPMSQGLQFGTFLKDMTTTQRVGEHPCEASLLQTTTFCQPAKLSSESVNCLVGFISLVGSIKTVHENRVDAGHGRCAVERKMELQGRGHALRMTMHDL